MHVHYTLWYCTKNEWNQFVFIFIAMSNCLATFYNISNTSDAQILVNLKLLARSLYPLQFLCTEYNVSA